MKRHPEVDIRSLRDRRSRNNIHIGIDIGGTFTDIMLVSSGRIYRTKSPSTPGDFARAILEGLGSLATREHLDLRRAGIIVHGTTVATNAILEQRGAPTALITTAGFRDVLELARLSTPRLYDAQWEKPPPLVQRAYRFEIDERIDANGCVLRSPIDDDILRVARCIVDAGIRCVAVSLLHSYLNSQHERQVRRVFERNFPDVHISISSEVLPELGEYERTSTTVVNAYVAPVVSRYIGSLQQEISKLGINAQLLIMQSNGGVMRADKARERPVHIIESGPAAGVTAALALARIGDYRNMITFDMGGTTAKAAIIEGGAANKAKDYEVGGGISRASRLVKGGGYLIRVPAIDIAEIGAGGGSVVSFDLAGGVQVGPRSAGAVPGPVCYDMGGEEPTVTDANVVLGYINPKQLAGGSQKIKAEAAQAAIRDVALRLKVTVSEAAYGIHTIANATMTRAIRAVSTERGRDPSEFVLCAFGGSGPIHAAEIARTMDISTVIIPPHPGLFSAYGLLAARIAHHYSRTLHARIDALDPARLRKQTADLEAGAGRELRRLGYRLEEFQLRRFLDLRYAGQSHSLTIAVPRRPVTASLLRVIQEDFRAAYEQTYGYRHPEEPIECVTLRVVAEARSTTLESGLHFEPTQTPAETTGARRNAYFGKREGVIATPILSRFNLTHRPLEGPLIVEEYDATTVVPPHATANMDKWGNIVIKIEPEVRRSKMSAAIELEIVKNALTSIADEMAVSILRTGRSTILKESADFSSALINANGELIAQGLTIPQHLGAMPDAISAVIRRFAERIYPGDAFILNDPYDGGMHLPDIFIFKPIFVEDELLAFTGVVAHQTDIGGRVPGSHATDSTEIYQEGLRIPLLKLWDRGRRNDTIFSFIEKNVRVPEKVLGDLEALIAASHFGEREFHKLVRKYGAKQLNRLTTALLDYTERLTRLEIQTLPDGNYAFTDYIDDDGLENIALPISVLVTITGDSIIVDFTGSSALAKGALNATYSFTKGCVYLALRCVMESEVPNTAGFFRPIQVIAPRGTIVNLVPPAACAARGLTGFRIADAIFGALAGAVPETKRFAAGEGGNSFITIGGYRDDAQPFVLNDLVFGAWGGRPGKSDGDAYPIIAGGCSNVPCELLEAEYPIRLLRYCLVPDTGGAGASRGGLAIMREFEFLADEAVLQVRSDRRKFPPWGLEGGMSGSPSFNYLVRGGETKLLPSKFAITIRRGDVFRHVTAGGGGYGAPNFRSRESIFRDLEEGRITPDHARRVYGLQEHEFGEGRGDIGETGLAGPRH